MAVTVSVLYRMDCINMDYISMKKLGQLNESVFMANNNSLQAAWCQYHIDQSQCGNS